MGTLRHVKNENLVSIVTIVKRENPVKLVKIVKLTVVPLHVYNEKEFEKLVHIKSGQKVGGPSL